MKLTENVHTDTGWEIYERALDRDQIVTTGSNYMIGNGYLGFRGTPAEWNAEHYVACIVAGMWDTAAPGALTELCNVPNGLFVGVTAPQGRLSLFDGETHDYERRIDLKTGTFSRRTTWVLANGTRVTVREERFASSDNVHLLMMRFRLSVDGPVKLRLRTGIDGEVWSLGGEHFASYETWADDALIGMDLQTVEQATRITVAEASRWDGCEPLGITLDRESRHLMRELEYELRKGDEIVLQKAVAIYHDNDVEDPSACAGRDAKAALTAGYEALHTAHCDRWEKTWSEIDIRIEGDDEAQALARFNLFHNIIHTPTHARLPVGARGLSSQVYQGAAFWDQETFNLPMFVYTRPKLARSILEYRHETLPGAKRKAARLGYRGAFYAWTSGATGDELFPDVFFKDVLTGREIRNHFNCWQIHISPDIVYAIWQYYEATGDDAFIAEHGAEIAFEVARFLVSRVHFKKDRNRFELIRLIGPDEYHENVDNNAYTMYLSKFALEKAVLMYEKLAAEGKSALERIVETIGLAESEVDDWREIANLIYLPQPAPQTRLIEQFDGYFEFEDIGPDDLRKRLLHPEEYWGWPNGIAVRTQVLKQADVLQLFALIDGFPRDVLRENYLYYERRTEHGSSLSPSVHAIIAARAGIADEAYRYFHEAATIDLYNKSRKVKSGGSFLGGIHTAACGGVWMMIVQGFAGFQVNGDAIEFDPALPDAWTSVSFRLHVRGNELAVRLDHSELSLTGQAGNPDRVIVRACASEQRVGAGEEVRFNLTP